MQIMNYPVHLRWVPCKKIVESCEIINVHSLVHVLLSPKTVTLSMDADTRLAARKPTIDQEFEQYFSMLML